MNKKELEELIMKKKAKGNDYALKCKVVAEEYGTNTTVKVDSISFFVFDNDYLYIRSSNTADNLETRVRTSPEREEMVLLREDSKIYRFREDIERGKWINLVDKLYTEAMSDRKKKKFESNESFVSKIYEKWGIQLTEEDEI